MRHDRQRDSIIRAKRREIARHYRRKAKRKNHGKPLTIAAIRIAQLTKLYDDRFGRPQLPESDEGVLCARIMVHHIARLKMAADRIRDWLHVCTPWLRLAERERLICDALEHPIKWRADKLAWRLGVTIEERDRLQLTTIGAVDMPKAERQKRSLQRKRQRQRLARRLERKAQGAKPRSDYLASSASVTKPWLQLGMSRRSWYRAGKPSHSGTGPSPTISSIDICRATHLCQTASEPSSATIIRPAFRPAPPPPLPSSPALTLASSAA